MNPSSWRLTLRVVTLLAWLVSAVWLLAYPGFEPLLAFLVGLPSLITSFCLPDTSAEGSGWESGHLRNVTPERIRENLGYWGAQIAWVDRKVTQVADLRTYGRIVIAGRMKSGKTREAAELIRRAVVEDLINRERIFEPGPVLRRVADEAQESPGAALRRFFDTQLPTLFFVDDLPHHFQGRALQRLDEVFSVLRECKVSYAVATARTDQLTDEHHAWFAKWGFHVITLPDFDDEQLNLLLDNAVRTFGLQIDQGARSELLTLSDRRPELILAILRRLRAADETKVDRDMIVHAARSSVIEMWAETRRYIVEQLEAADPLLLSLAAFYSAGVRPFRSLVIHYAAHLWRQMKHTPCPCMPQPALQRALEYLTKFDIMVHSDIVVYPDVAVEGLIQAEDAHSQLTVFLVQHRRLFQRRWLRMFYKDSEAHMWALHDLASKAHDRGQLDQAVRCYSAALRILPHFGPYNNRGVVHAEQGNLDAAIHDFVRTVELNPEYAEAFNSLANVYRLRGEFKAAIVNYDRAIALLTDDFFKSSVFHNRGCARKEIGDLDGAISDYDDALALNPFYVSAYSNRGGVYALQGNWSDAIIDLTHAISLDPGFADAYYNRANAYYAQYIFASAIKDLDVYLGLNPNDAVAWYRRGLANEQNGNPEKAIQDYGRAIALDPTYVNAYYKRANIYHSHGELGQAKSDYDEALTRNPNFSPAYYGRALLYRQEGNTDSAIADLQKFLELDTDPRWRQQAALILEDLKKE